MLLSICMYNLIVSLCPPNADTLCPFHPLLIANFMRNIIYFMFCCSLNIIYTYTFPSASTNCWDAVRLSFISFFISLILSFIYIWSNFLSFNNMVSYKKYRFFSRLSFFRLIQNPPFFFFHVFRFLHFCVYINRVNFKIQSNGFAYKI